MRVASILEYDGSRFSGWQRQDAVTTVQGCLEEALSKVANETVSVTVAGRTDAGVHASGQVVHFDTSSQRSDYGWLRGTNSNLPNEIAVRWVGQVDSEFHARYAATGRVYRYVILNRPVRPTYLAGRVTHDYRPLEVARMQAGAQYLVGTYDFSSFRAAECQARQPVRELRRLDITRQGEFVFIDAEANAFLHHMVRNIAGVLMGIGAGEREPDWAKEVLEARDRTVGGITAPPDGLYLTVVHYPAKFGVPVLSAALGLW
ncbi:MAG: tRNA pseudouridine(38-40) synthase TruA [Pseudomonadota bacterium]|nr:MAG: tRNA pseudouridine(38-40) synthase TruA [Pseudomonadota bacterium]